MNTSDSTGAGILTADEPKPKRVLVADDDADIRLVLKVILDRAGYEVLEASNGSEVLEIVAKTALDLVPVGFCDAEA